MPGTPSTTLTTFQIGTIAPLTGAFTSVFDCNDRSATFLRENGLSLPEPPIAETRSFNIRTPGESIPAQQYKNRQITYAMLLKASTSAGLWTAVRSLRAAIATKPFALRIALPGGAGYVYAICVKCTTDIPTDPKQILAKTITTIHLVFECLPGLLGDRVTLDNALQNPGFEAPSGPGVTVFTDPLTNANAYTVQAGGALSQDKIYYPDAVKADSPLRYYRLDEASGTVAYDASGSALNGTYTATGVTYGTTGLLTGDTDTAVTLNGTTGYITVPTTSLPSGNAPWSIEAVIKTPASFAATMEVVTFGVNGTTRGEPQLLIGPTGNAIAGTFSGDTAGFALSTSTIYHLAATWDGTTLTLYVAGSAVKTATPGALNVTPTYATIGATAAATPASFWNSVIKEVAYYGTCLSAARVLAHATAATTTPATNTSSMLIPAGGRVSFGSPNWWYTGNWGGINKWLVRFRYQTNQVFSCYVPYNNASNYTLIQFNQTAGGTLGIYSTLSGVTTPVATQTMHLVNGVIYQLQITLCSQLGSAGYVQAILWGEANGQLTSGTTVTGQLPAGFQGLLQLQAGTAAVGILANSVAEWGPGGWWFVSSGTGIALGHWDNIIGDGYANGPWPSAGSVTTQAPASGTLNAAWRSGDPSSQSSLIQTAIAVAAPGNTLSFSVQCQAPSVSVTCVNSVYFTEYDSNGNLLRTGSNAASHTGPLATYTALSGSYTTGANCAYALLWLSSVDSAGASAGAQIWWDTAQCWDQTATGMATMPYCELRFPQSPAQLLVSGLTGDLASPAAIAFGTLPPYFYQGVALTFAVGRRGVLNAAPAGISSASPLHGSLYSATQTFTPLLDANAYGGVRNTSLLTNLLGFEMDTFATNAAFLKGAYHFLSRLLTSQSAGNLANIKVRANVVQTGGGQTTVAYGNYVSPFSASNTLTGMDLGLVRIPLAEIGSLTDLNQLNALISSQWTDSSGTGSQYSLDWWMLLPVDGGVLFGQFVNPTTSPGALGGKWLWGYADGQGAALGLPATWGWSAETAALAAPAHAQGNTGTLAGSYISINPTGDHYLLLDPNQATSQGGVNVLEGVLFDQSFASVAPLHLTLTYTPQYLNPR